jgi:AcrR family transcriptional regulator
VADVMALVYDTRNDTEGNDELTPIERIERGNRQFVHVYREHGAMLALMEQAVAYDDEIRQLRRTVREVSVDRICRSIERMQQQGLARTDLDAACSASALVSMVSNFVYFWLIMDEGCYDDETAVHTLTELWASALQMRTD